MRISGSIEFCSVCLQNEDKEEATHSCSSCGNGEEGCSLKLCNFHTTKHSTKFPEHELVRLESACSSCPHHHLPINIFCRNCDSLICSVCGFSKEHKGHDCQLIDEIAETERVLVKNQVDELTDTITRWYSANFPKEDELNNALKKIEKKRNQARIEVCTVIEKIEELVKNRKEELIEECDSLFDDNSQMVKNMLTLKEQTQNLRNIFNEIDKKSNFELFLAKITTFNQVKKDFSGVIEKKNFNDISELYNISMGDPQSEINKIRNILSSMAFSKARKKIVARKSKLY